MPRANPKRSRGVDTLYVSFALDAEDAKRFRQFMADQSLGAALAARMMVASALYDDEKWWAVIRAERKTMAWEFRTALRAEFTKKMQELTQAIADETVLFTQERHTEPTE